jgi:hypothetical protein
MKQTILAILALSLLSATLISGCKGKDEQAEPRPGREAADKGQSQTAESNPEAEKAALECAEKWLAIVDQGDYDKSWEESAGLFRQVIPVEHWRNQLKVWRGGLGKLISRELKSKQYATTLPGAPDGQYVIIRYQSSFEKKNVAGERIVPMLDEDGTWRVSGYHIE